LTQQPSTINHQPSTIKPQATLYVPCTIPREHLQRRNLILKRSTYNLNPPTCSALLRCVCDLQPKP